MRSVDAANILNGSISVARIDGFIYSFFIAILFFC